MKYLNAIRTITAVAILAFLAALPANAENIKVTSLGSHKGELCNQDRALIFEYKETRILYDPGHTVIGADDPRLGNIDVVLVSHLHGDHVGDWHYPKKVNSNNTCAEWRVKDKVPDLPNTNAAKIAKYKKALIVTGSKMPDFFKKKLEDLGGVREKSIQTPHKIGGVTIRTVPAKHPDNSVNKGMTDEPYGPATGYVLDFSNGLAVYLSGDTLLTEEQDTVVRRRYGAKLVVMNIINPRVPDELEPEEPFEAARIISRVKPVSVIVSHTRGEAATKNGEVIGTKTKRFINIIKITDARVKVHVPLSEETMEFNSAGNCVAGC